MAAVKKEKKEINMILGARIRRQREMFGYSREAFSELLDITPRFLADIESGVCGVSLSTLKAICQVTHVSADYLLDIAQPEAEDESRANLHNSIDGLSPLGTEYAPQLLRLLDEVVRKATEKK